MRHTGSVAGALAAIALAFLTAPVQAAPVGGVVEDLKSAAGDGAQIEQVRHRCYRHRGHWHCPRHRYYRSYRPGIHFHFGPRRHYHRHHRHHRHYGHHRRHR